MMPGPAKAETKPSSQADRLETAADQAIVAGGQCHYAVKALMVANEFLVAQVGEPLGNLSNGNERGTCKVNF
jgi:hypothetical protein